MSYAVHLAPSAIGGASGHNTDIRRPCWASFFSSRGLGGRGLGGRGLGGRGFGRFFLVHYLLILVSI